MLDVNRLTGRTPQAILADQPEPYVSAFLAAGKQFKVFFDEKTPLTAKKRVRLI